MYLQLIGNKLGLIDMSRTAKILILSFLVLVFISCENKDVLPDNKFTVIVENESDIACSLPVIRFLDDLEKVKEKTSLQTLTYVAYRLDNTLNVSRAKLTIEFTKVEPEDLRACNTLGIAFPGVAIVTAQIFD